MRVFEFCFMGVFVVFVSGLVSVLCKRKLCAMDFVRGQRQSWRKFDVCQLRVILLKKLVAVKRRLISFRKRAVVGHARSTRFIFYGDTPCRSCVCQGSDFLYRGSCFFWYVFFACACFDVPHTSSFLHVYVSD